MQHSNEQQVPLSVSHISSSQCLWREKAIVRVTQAGTRQEVERDT